MTILDKYVMTCFFFMVLVILENVAYPAVQYASEEGFVYAGEPKNMQK
jgi:hypothetical protein